MNEEQIEKILEIVKINYPSYINEKNMKQMLDEWYEELQDYSFSDVVERLKQVMCEERFQVKPPTIPYITNGLRKLKNKINWDEAVYYCDLCHRPFNDLIEMQEHRARENSIEYIVRESKKWLNKTFDKVGLARLYEMSEEEFKTRYYKLLHYIHDHTTDEFEKTRIGFIFNPPNAIEARKYLDKEGLV